MDDADFRHWHEQMFLVCAAMRDRGHTFLDVQEVLMTLSMQIVDALEVSDTIVGWKPEGRAN